MAIQLLWLYNHSSSIPIVLTEIIGCSEKIAQIHKDSVRANWSGQSFLPEAYAYFHI